jgi:hypothetical protein
MGRCLFSDCPAELTEDGLSLAEPAVYEPFLFDEGEDDDDECDD